MVTKPIVSICCITYNHASYIRECLNGFVMQETNFPLEIIIHDDASTDGTAEIIKEYEEKYPGIVKPIYQEENQYSKGIRGITAKYTFPKAQGKYIALCEGDDYWTDPLKLQKQVNYLEQNPSIAICYHHVDYVDERNSILSNAKATDESINYSWQDIFHVYIPPLSVLFRNMPLKYPVPEEMKNIFNGDALLFGLLSSYGGATNLGFVGACYRQHNNGIYTGSSRIDNHIRSLRTRRTMYNSAVFNADQKKEIKKEINRLKSSYVKTYLKNRDFFSFIKILAS